MLIDVTHASDGL